MKDMESCPHIKDAGLHYCITGGVSYLPRPTRLRKFCMGGRHEGCGLYMAARDMVRPFTYADR